MDDDEYCTDFVLCDKECALTTEFIFLDPKLAGCLIGGDKLSQQDYYGKIKKRLIEYRDIFDGYFKYLAKNMPIYKNFELNS